MVKGYRKPTRNEEHSKDATPPEGPDCIQIAFDDHRLVANAGLLLPATLALHLGLGELVETGESRTPRPETPLIGYATSVFGVLVSLAPTPADGIRQRPADEVCGPGYRRRWGSIPE